MPAGRSLTEVRSHEAPPPKSAWEPSSTCPAPRSAWLDAAGEGALCWSLVGLTGGEREYERQIVVGLDKAQTGTFAANDQADSNGVKLAIAQENRWRPVGASW